MTTGTAQNSDAQKKTEPFVEVRFQELKISSSAIGLRIGYEQGEWCVSQFADYVMDWLPDFSPTFSELSSIHSGRCRFGEVKENVVASLLTLAKRYLAVIKWGEQTAAFDAAGAVS